MNLRVKLLKIVSQIIGLYALCRIRRDRRKNILIFRCGGLGDFLLETAAMHRLREIFPQDQYKIYYVHRSFNSETISKVIPVDTVLVFKESSFLQLVFSGIMLWKRRYEILINMCDPRYPLSHRILGLCHAKKKIAYDYPEHRFVKLGENEFELFRKEYDFFVNFSWENDHVMHMTTNLLQELSGQVYNIPCYSDYKKIHQAIQIKKMPLTKPYIVFSLFGSTNNRNLPNGKIEKLFQYCLQRYPDYSFVIAGAPKDVNMAEDLSGLMNNNPAFVNLCGKTSYCDLYSLAANAEFMIGIDSGITHFGALFSKHTFVLVRKHPPELFWPYPESFMKKITLVTFDDCDCDCNCSRCLIEKSPTPCMNDLPLENIINAIEAQGL